jgi:hypothetical protein
VRAYDRTHTLELRARGIEYELRETFDQFVGETLYGQMLKSMRKSLGKPAYFHGGRGEEVFQSQMDQLLVEQVSKASASSISGPMYELFAGRFSPDSGQAGEFQGAGEIPPAIEIRASEFESVGREQAQPRIDLHV